MNVITCFELIRKLCHSHLWTLGAIKSCLTNMDIMENLSPKSKYKSKNKCQSSQSLQRNCLLWNCQLIRYGFCYRGDREPWTVIGEKRERGGSGRNQKNSLWQSFAVSDEFSRKFCQAFGWVCKLSCQFCHSWESRMGFWYTSQ